MPEHAVAASPLVGFGSPWSLSLSPAACRDGVRLLPEQGPGLCWEKQLRVEIWRGRGGAGFYLPKGKKALGAGSAGCLSKGCSHRMRVAHGMKFWGDWRPAREIGYPSLGRHRDHHPSLSGIGWSTLWEVWGAQSREIWGRADGDAQG